MSKWDRKKQEDDDDNRKKKKKHKTKQKISFDDQNKQANKR
jgi:hypothetical protein